MAARTSGKATRSSGHPVLARPLTRGDAGAGRASSSRADRPRRALRPAGRSCVGCGAIEPTEAVRRGGDRLAPEGETQRGPLVRLVIGARQATPSAEGALVEIAVDTGDHTFGRGAYVHAARACLEAAAQRGLARAVKGRPAIGGVALTARALAEAIVEAYDRRIEGLLGAARRARRLAVGADAVKAALIAAPGRPGAAALCVVARDALAAASSHEVQRAVAEGRAVAWSTKSELARVVRGSASDTGVGVVALTDDRIARSLRETSTLVEALRAYQAAPPSAGTARAATSDATHQTSPRRAGVPGGGASSSSSRGDGGGAGSPRASTLAEGPGTLRAPNRPEGHDGERRTARSKPRSESA